MVADVQPEIADVDLELGEPELDITTAEPVAEVDPVTALRDEITDLKQTVSELSALRGLNPRQISAVMGQVGALQRDFANLQKGDPIAALAPQIAENEDFLGIIANVLASSDFLDDSSKSGLRQVVQRMESNKDARKATQLRRDVLKEVQEARGEIAQTQPQATPEAQTAYAVAQATQRLMDFAEGKDVAWDSIPPAELQFKEGETLPQAMTRVRKVITDLAGESAAAGRTAGRRRAAGAGAPASAGVNGYRTQVAVDTAHMEGRLTSQQVQQLRNSGRYDQLPYS